MATFHNSLLSFCNSLNDIFILTWICCPIVLPTWSTYPVCTLCMMNVSHEKSAKTSKVFGKRMIDRFGRDPRSLQLLFLSDADKSC